MNLPFCGAFMWRKLLRAMIIVWLTAVFFERKPEQKVVEATGHCFRSLIYTYDQLGIAIEASHDLYGYPLTAKTRHRSIALTRFES